MEKTYRQARWEDAVTEDARNIMGIRGWRRAAVDRTEWMPATERDQSPIGDVVP